MLNETQDTAAPALDIMEVAYADSFHQFDAELNVVFDENASKALDKKYWRVTKAFRYYIDPIDGNSFRQWVYVPAGFLTDGATVPKPFWFLLPPWGKYGQAAVVHDILCETATVYDAAFLPVKIDRTHADGVFREAMKVAGVNVFVRQLMYVAVRAWSKLGRKPNTARLELKRKLEAGYNVSYSPQERPAAIP